MTVTKKMWRPKQTEDIVVSTSKTTTPTPLKEDDANVIASSTTPIDSSSLGDAKELVETLEDEDEMLDYDPSPVHEGMDINMVFYLLSEFRATG